MKLKNFEKAIDSRVLSRGKDLYWEGAVVEFREEEPENWSAEVMGSQPYQVRIRLQEDTVVQHYCDCPYSFGPVCKHVVGTLLAIREDLEREAFANETGQAQKLQRKPSFRETVETVGAAVDKAELLKFIVKQGNDHRDFRNAFLLYFSESLGLDFEEHWRHVIGTMILKAERTEGFLTNAACEELAEDISPLLYIDFSDEEWEIFQRLLREAILEAQKSAEDYENHLEGLLQEMEGVER